MTLAARDRLGAYEIIAALGAGGMGQVYRARDTTLGRDVALKILPESVTHNADRLARFRREAQVLASLNHPHIAQIHGLDEADGTHFLVLELVDGESVDKRIARGPIPVDETLVIAKQFAEALEAAHEKGIIHRDLKPANIALTKDGQVKVLDFGLAKAIEPTVSSDPASSPVLTSPATMTGVGILLGTVAYMAPEQARGKAVDRRADIWAFGAVVYEMLTSQRVFKGEDTSEVLAAVLRQDVEWRALPPETPFRLRHLLERCLERDAKQRLRDIGEARIEIARIEQGTPDSLSGPIPAVMPLRSPRRRALPWMAAALAAAAVAASWWLGRRSAAPEAAWSVFTQLTDASGVETGPSLSPDGGSFAYSSAARGSWDIYVQRVGGRNPVLVAGDPARDEVWPAFSPDGKQIAFNLGGGTGGIFVMGATGESTRRLTDFGSNPAWSPDGQRIVFCTEEVRTAYNTFTESTLWSVDVNGGTPTKLDVDVAAFQPAWSPSGQRIAFWTNTNGQRDLGTIAAAGGQRVMVTSDAAVDWAPAWSPDGRFLYFASDRGGSMGIWRIAVDESSGRATGLPEPIAASVDVAMDLPHLSADGSKLVFRSMIQSVNPAAIDFDPATQRAGRVRLLLHRTGLLMPTDVSPDGRWIALTNVFDRQQDLFTMRSDGTGLSRLTDDLARDWEPRFTPDGTALVFSSTKSGTYDAWSILLDGSGRTRLTAITDTEVAHTMFAPDGRRLIAVLLTGDIVIGSAPWPITRQSATVIKAQRVGGGTLFPRYWSRDGRWLAGPVVMPSGELRGNALYDVAVGAVRQLSDDAASGDMAWMPGAARVIYFAKSGKLVIQNIATLARHDIPVTLPLPPDDVWSLAAAPDGRTLYYGAQQMEANIWKVERASPRISKP
jgi:serine/threonine protein kinase/Tol biopolymer transport system component